MKSPECSNCEQWAMHSANSERPTKGAPPPNPRECSNCLGSGRNIQRITMCPHGYHHNGFMETPALGTYIYMVIAVRAHCNPLYIYIYIYIYILTHVLLTHCGQ